MREISNAERRDRLDQFLRMLFQVRKQFDWRLDRFQQIRGFAFKARVTCCPITALAYADSELICELTDVHAVADELAISEIAWEIVEASDWAARVPDLRVRIMKVVGL